MIQRRENRFVPQFFPIFVVCCVFLAVCCCGCISNKFPMYVHQTSAAHTHTKLHAHASYRGRPLPTAARESRRKSSDAAATGHLTVGRMQSNPRLRICASPISGRVAGREEDVNQQIVGLEALRLGVGGTSYGPSQSASIARRALTNSRRQHTV
jgi:hypothetical protein